MFPAGRRVHSPASRFTLHPAIGLRTGDQPEVERATIGPREVVESEVGGWILEEQPGLGTGEATGGSFGRGAEAWIPVVIWLAGTVGAGVIGNAAWTAARGVVRRLMQEGRVRFYVSRGMAAALAADQVAREFQDAGPFTLEAADEPSSLGGHEPSELSYVGIEPWIVLLRGTGDENRYTVVVEADGRVSGVLRTPIEEWQRGYQRGPIRVEPAEGNGPRRRLLDRWRPDRD